MNGEIKQCFVNGEFIGVKESENTFMVQKTINLDSLRSAKIRATAHGLYFICINGERVGKDYLTPGATSYLKMLQVQEYDVTDLLKIGKNTIEITVNDGWFAGRFGVADRKNIYGTKASVLASLKVIDKNGEEQEFCTDSSWFATQSYIVNAGIYDGEIQDYTRVVQPLTVQVFNVDKSVLVEQICEPVRDIEKFSVQKVIRTPKGEIVYDFGQNISGVVYVQADDAKEITLQFGEVLDQNGNFYLENLRSATGTATVKTDRARKVGFEFTYFGFRYVKIATENVKPEEITAVVRRTEMKRTGKLSVSDAKLNRFLENVVWSQRDNFVDIPTDCPQRDERLGWTGDINAFCTTASFNYDVRLILKKWLADLRNDQTAEGEIPVVAPNVLGSSGGLSAMWCDSCIMIPWKLYNHYGDISFLKENYSMMKKYLAARARNIQNGLFVCRGEFGDWLSLDYEACQKTKQIGGTDFQYIGNVFYIYCLELMAKIADILGCEQDSEQYYAQREQLLDNVRAEFITSTGRLAIPTVTAHVLALQFGIAEEKDRARIAEELNQKVIKNKYHVITGFIGTTYLLSALAENGYWDTAEKVLMNEEYPGWLHEVDMGATTVWERWDSLMEDGTPNPAGMTSFNHYAYGSVMEFVYRKIAGIEQTGIGFSSVTIQPHPIESLDSVSAEYESVNGIIKSSYERKNGTIIYRVTIPESMNAQVCLSGEPPICVQGGSHEFVRQSE